MPAGHLLVPSLSPHVPRRTSLAHGYDVASALLAQRT